MDGSDRMAWMDVCDGWMNGFDRQIDRRMKVDGMGWIDKWMDGWTRWDGMDEHDEWIVG